MNASNLKQSFRQIAWLIVYDLRQQLRERGTLLLLAVALVLAGIALAQGENFRRNVLVAMYQASGQQTTAQSAAQTEAAAYFANPADPQYATLRWWRTAFDLRGYAFREHLDFAIKPLLPGAALAIGQADVLPAVVRVRAESMDSVRQASDLTHPERLAAGRFDLLFFVVCLWPLVLLALTLSVLTQDRESKRLPALALLGVTPQQVLLGQAVARTLAASLVLVLALGVWAGALGALPASWAGLTAWAAWAAVVLAYSLFWAGVAALVCARASSRSTAAFAGFGAWVGIVVLLPAVLAAAVTLLAPLPSQESLIVATRDSADQVQRDRVSVMTQFYEQHPEWRLERTALDKLPTPVTRMARAVALERALTDVNARHDQARHRQVQLLQTLSLFSPVSMAFDALSGSAGQDAQRHQEFLAEVRLHQLALRDFFQARLQQAARNDERQPCAPVDGKPSTGTCKGSYGFDDFQAVPRFQASAALSVPPALPAAIGWLLAWAAVLLAWAAWWSRARKGS